MDRTGLDPVMGRGLQSSGLEGVVPDITEECTGMRTGGIHERRYVVGIVTHYDLGHDGDLAGLLHRVAEEHHDEESTHDRDQREREVVVQHPSEHSQDDDSQTEVDVHRALLRLLSGCHGLLLGDDGLTLSCREKEADAYIEVKKLSAEGSSFSLIFEKKVYDLSPRLIGLHNIYNAAESFLLAIACGADAGKAVQILQQRNIAPPGRLEGFFLPSGAGVFVDYAHTDDALARVLESLVPLKEKRLLTLFGCGGDRDRTKRPRMALAASRFSDMVMVTSDNPRTEEPSSIIEDIVKGFPEDFVPLVEVDRGKAIEKLLSMGEKGDIILIAGKGHENYQESNGVKSYFDDRDEVRKYIKSHE